MFDAKKFESGLSLENEEVQKRYLWPDCIGILVWYLPEDLRTDGDIAEVYEVCIRAIQPDEVPLRFEDDGETVEEVDVEEGQMYAFLHHRWTVRADGEPDCWTQSTTFEGTSLEDAFGNPSKVFVPRTY